jgi:hypothetical protein
MTNEKMTRYLHFVVSRAQLCEDLQSMLRTLHSLV